MTEETQEKIRYAESVAYVYFVVENSKYLKSVSKSPNKYDCWDCSGITTNNRKFVVEFKIRDKYAKQYSGSTMIENSKLKALQAIWKQNKDVTILYICYFNDVCISFNLSKRFKQGANSDILATYIQPCKRTTMDAERTYTKDKLVNFLCYDAEMWHDKIIRYV